MKKIIVTCLLLLITTMSFASGGGSSSQPLKGMYPIVLSHGMGGWGADSKAIVSITKYWGGLDTYLRSKGAVVYNPTKSAFGSNAGRGLELKNLINKFMASGGYTKVHIIGHSQGGLDSRYTISNLAMASKVSTLTTVATPHRGSPIADIAQTVIPSWALPYVATLINAFGSAIYGSNTQNILGSLNSLTTSGTTAFNNTTPNAAGVKYYSYGSHITIPDLIQHPIMGLMYPAMVIGGSINGQGTTNDGLVPITSAKWGIWKGEPSYGILVTGIDHFESCNGAYLGQTWYDVKGWYLKIASNAKANQ